MLKLYKTIKGRVAYWEAWPKNTKILAHWGWLGHWGQTKLYDKEPGETEKKAIKRLAAAQRTKGFAEIPEDDHYELVIQRAVDGWGSVDDLDTREAIYNVANEWLGWTGNGACHGGDIGSGTINVFCHVVDPKLAIKVLELHLRKAKLMDDAITMAYAPNRRSATYTIGWPPRSKKRFSLLGTKAKPRASGRRST